MEICCDICGNVGYKEALITCSQCKINIEHMYCMRVILIEPPSEWHCKDCESISTFASAASNVMEELSKSVQGRQIDYASSSMWHAKRRKHSGRKKEKKVETGKTKFLTPNEVVALNSGTSKTVTQRASGIKIVSHSTPPTTTVPNRAFPEKIVGASGSPLQLSKRKRMCSTANTNIFSTPEVQESQSRKRTEVQRQASRNEDWIDDYMQKKETSVMKLQQTKEKSIKERSLASPPSLIAPPGFNSSGVNGGNHVDPSTLKAHENLHLKLLPDASKFISTGPAADVVWKGTSSFWDTIQHRKQSIKLQANPTVRIRRKAYELSKNLPEALSFSSVPSQKFRSKLFPNHSPDKRDIGLYFFRHDSESPESYTSLVKDISAKDMALMTLITADVELMVFPSTCFLSGQYWQGEIFLWGVFRHLKGDKIAVSSVDKGKRPPVKIEKANLGIPPGFENWFPNNRAG